MKMFYIYEHKRIAKLNKVIRNKVVVDDWQLVPETSCGLGVVVVRFVVVLVDASAVGVPEGLVVLDEEETDETMGSGVTSSVEEFWAFEYEAPPPRTWASDWKFQPFALIML